MLFKKAISVAAVVAAVGFAAVGCTDDKKKTSEAVSGGGSGEPASPTESKTVGGVTVSPVYFSFDDYTVNASSQTQLTKMAEQMKANKGTVIQVEGHCDERGSIEYNLALGERRAQAVKNYLTNLGVEPARLSTISYGEERPASEGHDEAAWQKNRRAEFNVTKQ
ncbi:peptidoglycan-associated lipoprotein Pal [bacterium]|nr:peptidoglycan-associated lipoprotein Pal [bacterium]